MMRGMFGSEGARLPQPPKRAPEGAPVLLWFWLNLPDLSDAPCGAVACDGDGKVKAGAPVLVKRFRGWRLNAIIRRERGAGRRAEWARLQQA